MRGIAAPSELEAPTDEMEQFWQSDKGRDIDALLEQMMRGDIDFDQAREQFRNKHYNQQQQVPVQ